MTLPIEISLPKETEQLNEALERMYEDIVQNVNGTIQAWTPKIIGLSTEGTGTYVSQFGWYRRAGIMTEVWFDVSWSAHTGTGNVAILLPYFAAKTSGDPWAGVIESSAANTFGAGFTYLVMTVDPNTPNGRIFKCGTGVPSAALAIAGSGGFRGYIRYIGQELENT